MWFDAGVLGQRGGPACTGSRLISSFSALPGLKQGTRFDCTSIREVGYLSSRFHDAMRYSGHRVAKPIYAPGQEKGIPRKIVIPGDKPQRAAAAQATQSAEANA